MSSKSSRLLRSGSCVPRKAYGHYEFLICDWSLMNKDPGNSLRSENFLLGDTSEWALQVFIGGKSIRQAGYVTCEVILMKTGEEETTTATITLSVLRQKDYDLNNTRFDSQSFQSPTALSFSVGDEFAMDNFMNTSDLEERYIHRDSVLFGLDVEVLGKPATLTRTMPAFLGQLTTLHDDLYSGLLKNTTKSFSDITIVVEENKFYLHKCILAARSSFFMTKFCSQGFNTRLLFRGSLSITNIDSKIFQEVVCFIYTDECSHTMLLTRGLSLLKAAVYFNLPKLIQICEDYIGESLTPETVVDVFNQSSVLKLERLGDGCSEFIAEHLNSVLVTKTLQNLHPLALKGLIARSVIPAQSLQTPHTSIPQKLRFSQIDAKKEGDIIDKEGEEEMKDTTGSWTEILSAKKKLENLEIFPHNEYLSHDDDL